MKKVLAIILCVIMVIASCVCLVGCVSTELTYDDNLVKEIKRDKNVYTVLLNSKQYVDTLVLEETADKVTGFGVYGKKENGDFELIYKNDRIDKYRVCSLDGMETDELRIEIFSKLGDTKINSIKAYNSTRFKRKSDFKVTEYVVTGEQNVQKLKATHSKHFGIVDDAILIGEIGIDENAEILYREGKSDFIDDINTLRAIAVSENNPNMNIVVSVRLRDMAINDKDNTNKIISEGINKHIDKITSNIAAFATEFGIAGIDFDWEYPENSKQWKSYSLLIVEVSKKLAELDKYVTVALPPWGVKLSKEAQKAVKYVNLMTYDLFDERGEHASFYSTTKQSVDSFLIKTHFTKEQIMLGLSSYGRTINKSGAAWPDMKWDYEKNNHSLGKWGNYILDYEYKEKGVTKYCDAYINGYAITRDKTSYAIASDLGGVMIFRMACDAPDSYEYNLHNAVRDALQRGIDIA